MMATPDLPRDASRSRSSARRRRSSTSRAAESIPEEYGDVDFYRTQYELLKSRTLAERVVEQLEPEAARLAPAPKSDPWWSAWLPAELPQWWASVRAREPAAGDAPGTVASPADVARSASESAVGAFMGSLTVEPVRNSRLVRVLFDSPDPQARRRRAERAGAELHRGQPRAALRRVVVREDLPRGTARADQGEARGLRARAGRVPARAADHQRRREAERARADAGLLQRGGGQGRRGPAEGRGAVPRVQGEPRVLAADDREQVDGGAARAAHQAAGRVPGPAAHLQAGVSQDAAAEGVDRRDRQEDQGGVRHRAARDRGHVQRRRAAGSEHQGQARVVQEGRARPAGPQHPLQHPQARGRHQPLALRRPAAAAEGSRRARRAWAPTT